MKENPRIRASLLLHGITFGQPQQGAVNLYYYNARWYDPKLGRFTQSDTLIPNPADPQSWDRYAYVKNNPLRYSDPSGKRECEGMTSSDCGFMPPKTITVLKSMFNDYGITLNGNWTVSEGYSAYVAVYKVSDKLKAYSHKGTIATFNHAFGKMEFTISNDLGGWYGLGGDGHISILAGVISVRLVTHELAHAFEKHIFNKNGDKYYGTNNPIQMLAEFGIHDEDGNLVTGHGTRNNGNPEPKNGYETDKMPDQYHPISMQGGDCANEDWADMFMNWIFDSFSDTPAGKARYAWVENNMPTWIR